MLMNILEKDIEIDRDYTKPIGFGFTLLEVGIVKLYRWVKESDNAVDISDIHTTHGKWTLSESEAIRDGELHDMKLHNLEEGVSIE